MDFHPSDKKVTLSLITYDGKILLSQKREGFGSEYLNGFGGKVEPGETILEAVCRETMEEQEIELDPKELELGAIIDFYFPHKPKWNQQCYSFISRVKPIHYAGTTEMKKAQEYELSAMPYEHMWPADRIWIPLVLEGKKVTGEVYFTPEQDVDLEKTHIDVVDALKLE